MGELELALRRARRPDSLAAAVSELLDELQCPVSTEAVRVILNDRGRPVTAEHLSRLAAYQREDFARTRMLTPLSWALNPDGAAVIPRWWARGDWRLLRRLRTKDVTPIWFANLATNLCADLAGRTDPPSAMVTLALGAANLALGGGEEFPLPMTNRDWMRLREQIYAPHNGALSNRTGGTAEQYAAEAALNSANVSGFELLFGRCQTQPCRR